MWIDGRIPLCIATQGEAAPKPDAVLVVAGQAAACVGRGWGHVVRLAMPLAWSGAHGAGCVCCGPASPQVTELRALVPARARGEIVFFRALVIDLPPEPADILRQIFVADPYLSAYFVEARRN